MLLLFTLIMSILFTAHAGYLIRGITINPPSTDDLKNYTLSFYKDDGPISAASMHTMSPYTGKNTIVIIHANSQTADFFPIQLGYSSDINDIEVRDFQYDKPNDRYLLCGSLLSDLGLRAFVAVINGSLTQMEFFEYPEADVFYSIWTETISSLYPLDFYVCGKKDHNGVIASIDRRFFQLTHLVVTDIDWEYHKIIATGIQHNMPDFVVSGRNPGCTQIGFTVLDWQLNTLNSYWWGKNTESASHCVLCHDVLVDNAVILASSYGNVVTLNPVTYPISPLALVPEYRYAFPVNNMYYVQDIDAIKLTGNSFRISVAGFCINPLSTLHITAWHGSVMGLSTTGSMLSNYYYEEGEIFEHYKIRYLQDLSSIFPKEYTGGSFQNIDKMCALFGTPLTPSECDHFYTNYPGYQQIGFGNFSLHSENMSYSSSNPESSLIDFMDIEHECPVFKGGAPELTMPTHNESEIATFYDHITVQDIPENTSYQIYSVTGQLIQTGTATPDISTANLSKGIYILRLENGKVFKFVK